MKNGDALHVIDLLIEYFETGNKETDRVAKFILESDFQAADFWREKIRQLGEGADWSGVRAIEADILVAALREIRARLSGNDCPLPPPNSLS